MSAAAEDSASPLEKFRNYLLVLARSLLHPRLQGKLDASDLVQETFLRALRGWSGFLGTTDGQLVAWLRTILRRVLLDALRDRDPATASRLESWAQDDQTSPSQHAQRHEHAVLLADALVQLPETQRRAIELQKFHGWSQKEIADHLGKSQTAVAGLLKRGLERLRVLVKELE
jgi:RNA polymerase sigma-70 factor (ECF subfamily)